MHQAKAGANLWTDSYLAAFACQTGITLVTFDRGFTRFTKTPLFILEG
jgi:predicted nucleic acid-binding protein